MVIETRLSYFHKMAVAILKTSFTKQQSNTIIYRNYKQFSNTRFREELDLRIGSYVLSNLSNDMFTDLFMGIFNKHASIKFKVVRANNNPFMVKDIRKAITKSKTQKRV